MEVAIVSMRDVCVYIQICFLISFCWGRSCSSLFHLNAGGAICGLVLSAKQFCDLTISYTARELKLQVLLMTDGYYI